jgi:hypothetical protein
MESSRKPDEALTKYVALNHYSMRKAQVQQLQVMQSATTQHRWGEEVWSEEDWVVVVNLKCNNSDRGRNYPQQQRKSPKLHTNSP